MSCVDDFIKNNVSLRDALEFLYQKAYQNGYKDGQETMWNIAKDLVVEIPPEDWLTYFGYCFMDIFVKLTAEEVIDKYLSYKEETKKNKSW